MFLYSITPLNVLSFSLCSASLQWYANVQSSALSALRDRPLAGALLSEGGASESGGLLDLLGLGNIDLSNGGVLQQMAQSVQDSLTGGGRESGGSSSGSSGSSSGSGIFGGGLFGGNGNGFFGGNGSSFLGGGNGQQLLDGSLAERLSSMFGSAEGQGFLEQLLSGMGGATGGGSNMFQNAGRSSGGGGASESGSLASRYYNKAAGN